uniref:Tc1-like transposase DDE domain-containing protein n=1 Tax=Acanthochromis polyacanthus TaxID=80966 RepID=A0A3Q1EJ70_9TELE
MAFYTFFLRRPGLSYLRSSRVWVRRRPGEALSPACTVPTVKHGGGSIMVWAGIGHLTVCDHTLNSVKYCTILQTHMLRMFQQNWTFQQENSPCHTSRTSRTWLQEHSIQVSEWLPHVPVSSSVSCRLTLPVDLFFYLNL